jgi:hypothetical protein
MDQDKAVNLSEIITPEITVGPADGLSSDLEVRVDGTPVVTVHYVYPWIDNSTQYAIAEKIVKMFKVNKGYDNE